MKIGFVGLFGDNNLVDYEMLINNNNVPLAEVP